MAVLARRFGSLTLFCILGSACSPPPDSRLSIRGSDSEVNLVQRLAEAFMHRYPDTFISVTGGGSGVGIAALIDDACDIATSSRPMYPEERLLALRNQVKPKPHVFASDALTVIVHESNPLAALDFLTISQLFQGKIERWSELGGKDLRVVVYGRQASSGTYLWFRDQIVRGEYTDQARQMNGTAQIVEAVGRDPSAVGYVAVGYLQGQKSGVRAVPIRVADGQIVSPLDHRAVKSGRYPITRPLFQLTNGSPSPLADRFMRFEGEPENEELILDMGFFPPSTSQTAPQGPPS